MTAPPSLALRATDPRSAIEQRSVTLQFDDNALLPMLHGEHDRHLARIEQVLGVRVASRGNRIVVSGGAERTEMAEAALLALWKRLEQGQPVGTAEVEAALRLAEGGAEQGEPRLPLADLPAIRTRKGAIAPRSPAQGAYIEMLARQDMVSASARPARARPTSRSRKGSRCCNPDGWTASCCPAPRSRPGNASASCRAT